MKSRTVSIYICFFSLDKKGNLKNIAGLRFLGSIPEMEEMGAEDKIVLTSYTCDTLVCSRKEGRQSRRKPQRKRDVGLKYTKAAFNDILEYL